MGFRLGELGGPFGGSMWSETLVCRKANQCNSIAVMADRSDVK